MRFAVLVVLLTIQGISVGYNIFRDDIPGGQRFIYASTNAAYGVAVAYVGGVFD